MEQTDILSSAAPSGSAAELYAAILGDLPPFPPLVLRLAQLASSRDTSVDEIVELLRSDAALSAELLRRANSPAYGFSARIDTLQQALVLLGFDELRRIALATAAKGFAGLALTAPELRLCWRHSLAVALLAEELARGTHIAPERAYTAGVMHDIGRLGLLTARPGQFQRLLKEAAQAGPIEDSSYFLDRETAVFGFDHTEAGRWLAERWEMPVELRAAAGRHHDRPSGAAVNLLSIVQYAVLLADALGFGVVTSMARCTPGDWAGEPPPDLAPVLERDPVELAELLESRIDVLDGPMPDACMKPHAAEPDHQPAELDPTTEDRARALLPWAIGAVAALAAAVGYVILSS